MSKISKVNFIRYKKYTWRIKFNTTCLLYNINNVQNNCLAKGNYPDDAILKAREINKLGDFR